jgi:hypothetical protein
MWLGRLQSKPPCSLELPSGLQVTLTWSNLKTLDKHFFYAGIQALMSLGQRLKCQWWMVGVWCVLSATHVSCICWNQKKVLSISACVLNIRFSLWCVNRYFKELFVLKVTFKVICLNSFVTCLTYGLTHVSYVFIVSYFPPHHSTGTHVIFFIYLVPGLLGLLTGKLCIWLITYMQPVCAHWDQISYVCLYLCVGCLEMCLVSHHEYLCLVMI